MHPPDIVSVIGCKVPALANKFSCKADHLFLFETFFQIPLVVATAGIGSVILHSNNPMKHKLTAFSSVKRQVIFIQLFRCLDKGHLIPSAEDRRVHAASGDGQRELSSGGKNFLDHRIHIREVDQFLDAGLRKAKLLVTQCNLPLSALRQSP